MNELERAFPEGIKTHNDAIAYLARWYSIKFLIQLDGHIRVTTGNVTKYMDPEAILQWGQEWFDQDMETSREAAIQLAHREEERRKKAQITTIIEWIVVVAIAIIGIGFALYIFGGL